MGRRFGRCRRCSGSASSSTFAAWRCASPARLKEVESADRAAANLREASEESHRSLAAALASFVDNHPPFTPTWVAASLQQVRSYQTELPAPHLARAVDRRRRAERGEAAAALESSRGSHSGHRRRPAHNQSPHHLATGLEGLRQITEPDRATAARGSFLRRNDVRNAGSLPPRSEHVAKRVKEPPEEIAKETVALARGADQTDVRHSHVGYYLVDN